MKITIDTQNDSDEDIKKTIRFLQDLVNTGNIMEEASSESDIPEPDESSAKKTENYEPMGISWY